MKHNLLRLLSYVIALFVSAKPVIHLRIKDFGVLGHRVYVADENFASVMRTMTGNKSFTIRQALGLKRMGYRLRLAHSAPVEVPIWLAPHLDACIPV